MKVAVMQPYFFPYIGQFQLINAVDRFLLCDDVQYIRHGWVNRNRILKQEEGFQYIIAPVLKTDSRSAIKQVKVIEGGAWRKTILGQIAHYKKKAPYYRNVYRLLESCLSTDETDITRLNGACFKQVCDYLEIKFEIEVTSTLNLDYSQVKETQDWALEICRQVGATEYYNPPGGVELYDRKDFERNNIKLRFVKPHLREYNQFRADFFPGLSIIDVMMFNAPEEIKSMLNDYEIL